MILQTVPSPPSIQLSVVVLTRNRVNRLRECIASLLPQVTSGEEILVCDTGSTDETLRWLASLPPPVRFVKLSDPSMDFASARNYAVEQAVGEWIALLDDDCVAASDWLSRVKSNLAHFEAVGGPVLPARLYAYPKWWSGEFAWTIGMSPRGLILGREDCYPATANLAFHRSVWQEQPFVTSKTPLGSAKQYLSGREDAQWWFEARRRGKKLHIDIRQIVFHNVPSLRLKWPYVIDRARMDGAVAWERFPEAAIAKRAGRESGRLLVRLAVRPWRCVTAPAIAAEQFIWGQRQQALAGKAESSTNKMALSLKSERLKGVLDELRYVGGTARLHLRLSLRSHFHIPDRPLHILFAAPTYLGDTVLLQPIVQLLARTWPHANIVVWTSFPDILATTDPRIQIISTDPANDQIILQYARCSSQINFVPYYHFGSTHLWREILSSRAVSFDRDVGFQKISDYFLSARRVAKNFSLHEHINLLQLVSLWPLVGDLHPPRLEPSASAMQSLHKQFPALQEVPYVTLHIDTALEMKRWPLERWHHLARVCHDDLALHCVFIGNARASALADSLVHQLGSRAATNACGVSLSELIALIGGAKLAIGPCSGPKHIAYALRVPTFTLYGAVSEERWGAWFDRSIHAYLRSPVQYLSPHEQCGLPDNHAMLLISAEEAAVALRMHARNLGIIK